MKFISDLEERRQIAMAIKNIVMVNTEVSSINEAKIENNAYCIIQAPKDHRVDPILQHFIGARGYILCKEGKLCRVQFETPVFIDGIGEVKDDLFEPRFIKVIK